jgi:hypothetical protein
MNILLIYPNRGSNRATNFARECALYIKEKLGPEREMIKEIRGNKAVRDHIVRVLKSTSGQDGAFLCFGHGGQGQLVVKDGECALYREDAHLLKGKTCYVFACRSFNELGAAAIDSGASVFIGFSEDFWVPHVFMEDMMHCCSIGIVSYLLHKCSSKEIEFITKEAFEVKLDEIVNHDIEGNPGRVIYSIWCFQNAKDIFRFHCGK